MPAHNIAQTTPTSWARSGLPLGLRVKRVQLEFQKKNTSDVVKKKNLTARKRLRRENRR